MARSVPKIGRGSSILIGLGLVVMFGAFAVWHWGDPGLADASLAIGLTAFGLSTVGFAAAGLRSLGVDHRYDALRRPYLLLGALGLVPIALVLWVVASHFR